MLGSAVFEYLTKKGIDTYGTSRKFPRKEKKIYSYDALDSSYSAEFNFNDFEYIINCIGVIKPRISEKNLQSLQEAYKANSIFPWILSTNLINNGTRIIQIATDCVFNGIDGNYYESSNLTPNDTYGISKMLGEVHSKNITHLRCSIIGPEKSSNLSLFEWFKRLPRNSVIDGYLNHKWNGITTLSYAKILCGLLETGIDDGLPNMNHIVPVNSVSKLELLQLFQKFLGRNDIRINPTISKLSIDRTLNTRNPEINAQLWQNSDYKEVKNIEFLVEEMINNKN